MTNIISNKALEQSNKWKNSLLYMALIAWILSLWSCGHETVQEAQQKNLKKIEKEINENNEDITDYKAKIKNLENENAQLNKEKAERESR